MARLVVTGGMGFIGSAFVRRRLASTRDEVVVVDKLTYAGNPNNLKEHRDDPRLTFVKGDVCDGGLMDRVAKGADAVVHFAAETHVDRSILDAGVFVETDVVGTFRVLEACRRADVGRLVHISTDEVYGEAHGAPCTEDGPLGPHTPPQRENAAPRVRVRRLDPGLDPRGRSLRGVGPPPRGEGHRGRGVQHRGVPGTRRAGRGRSDPPDPREARRPPPGGRGPPGERPAARGRVV